MVELTDVAADVLVGLEAEGYDRNETEREPLPALVDSCAEVAAVLALRCDVLVAFEEGGEGVRAAGEDECHVGCCCVAKLKWTWMGRAVFAKSR